MALSFPRKANTPELKSDIWAIVREEKPPDNARKCVAAPVAFTTGHSKTPGQKSNTLGRIVR